MILNYVFDDRDYEFETGNEDCGDLDDIKDLYYEQAEKEYKEMQEAIKQEQSEFYRGRL